VISPAFASRDSVVLTVPRPMSVAVAISGGGHR
jgi:hypothetical protein